MSNPTEAQIVAALQTKMEALAQPGGGEPNWESKLLGIEYKPAAAPYQRGTWMPARRGARNDPVAIGSGAYYRLEGIFQIDLFYPKSARRTDRLFARAEAMKLHFYPADGQGGSISAGGGAILIDRKPLVSALDENSDAAFNRVFLEVYARVELPPG